MIDSPVMSPTGLLHIILTNSLQIKKGQHGPGTCSSRAHCWASADQYGQVDLHQRHVVSEAGIGRSDPFEREAFVLDDGHDEVTPDPGREIAGTHRH